MFLEGFWPILARGTFSHWVSGNIIVSCRVGFPLQDGPHTKAQRASPAMKGSDLNSSFFQNEGKWRSHQSCVLFAVWEGAPSCWKVNGLSLKCFFTWTWAGVKRSAIYKFALILEPSLTKMRGDFQLSEMAAQTIIDTGFWRQKTDYTDVGILSALFAKFLSFCELNLASTANVFSSEKIVSPACVPSFIVFKRIYDLSCNLFCFCNDVSCCLLVIFKGNNLRSSLTMILTLFFINFQASSPCPHALLGVPPYSLPNDFNFGLCASRSGRSHMGRLLHVPSSLLRITASLSVYFAAFKSLTICGLVFPAQRN